MIAIVIEHPEEPPRRKVLPRARAVSIGRGGGNDVVLAGAGIEELHAYLTFAGKRVEVERAGAGVVMVDGKRLVRPRAIGDKTIGIGTYTLRVIDVTGAAEALPAAVVDATERGLLEAIGDREDASRLVYADWLEERGDLVRAEFLRVQVQLATPGGDDAFERSVDRLRELGAHVSPSWRARVARPAIEGCDDASFDFQCPKEWGSLQVTERERVRFCGTCKSDVFYTTSIAEARRHAEKDECVAIDLQAARWDDDLAAPFRENVCPACKLDVGPTAQVCPRCSTRVRAMMMRGKIRVVP